MGSNALLLTRQACHMPAEVGLLQQAVVGKGSGKDMTATRIHRVYDMDTQDTQVAVVLPLLILYPRLGQDVLKEERTGVKQHPLGLEVYQLLAERLEMQAEKMLPKVLVVLQSRCWHGLSEQHHACLSLCPSPYLVQSRVLVW